VREGERVARGQEVARLDDTQLREAAAGADATLQKARAELRAARAALARLQRVFAAGIAARQEVDDATARVAAAQASEGEAAAAAAQAHLQIERSVVRSPLDGVVVGVFRHAGDLVDGTAATPVLRSPTRPDWNSPRTPRRRSSSSCRTHGGRRSARPRSPTPRGARHRSPSRPASIP